MDRPLEKSVYRRFRIPIVAACAVAVVLLVGALARSAMTGDTVRVARSNVSFGVVKRGVLREFLPLRVTVVPHEMVFIDATEGGRVETISARPGDVVKAGQTLVVLSNTQLELQILEHEGRLIESITQVQNYQTALAQNRTANDLALKDLEYNIARLTRAYERRRELGRQGVISRESVDQIQDELESLKQKLPLQKASNMEQAELRRLQAPQIRAQLDSLKKNIEITRSKLQNLTVRAPYDGRVISVDLTLGQTLREGDRLAQISRDTGYKLTQEVDEFYLPRLRTGQEGAIETAGRSWPVRVSRLYPEIKNGAFTVDLEFTGTVPEDLLPGQTLLGKLNFGAASETLYMPAGPFLERSGGAWVFVVNASGTGASRREIATGRRNIDQVEVLRGLAPGDQILTSDYGSLEKVEFLKFD